MWSPKQLRRTELHLALPTWRRKCSPLPRAEWLSVYLFSVMTRGHLPWITFSGVQVLPARRKEEFCQLPGFCQSLFVQVAQNAAVLEEMMWMYWVKRNHGMFYPASQAGLVAIVWRGHLCPKMCAAPCFCIKACLQTVIATDLDTFENVEGRNGMWRRKRWSLVRKKKEVFHELLHPVFNNTQKEKHSRRPDITINSLKGTKLGLRTNFSVSVKGDNDLTKVLRNLDNSQKKTC